MSDAPLRLTSRTHPFVKRCRALAAGRGPAGDVLLDGAHLVGEALDAGLPIAGVIADDRHDALARATAARGAVVYHGTPDVLAAASPVRASSGIVAIAAWTPHAAADLVRAAPPLVVGLVDIQDPGNVGGIIRTADALGASAALTLDATAHPGGWKALRGAMGSTFRLPVGRGASDIVITAARSAGMTVAASSIASGVAVDRWTPTRPVLVLVGNEGAGLPTPLVEAADVQLTIPMAGTVNSLNVGVSAALLVWELARERRHGRPS